MAISANARFLEFADTHFQDLRMAAWERSHDTRMQDCRMLAWEKSFDLRTQEEVAQGRGLRVGLPERYFVDIADYFKRMKQFPFILYGPDNALKIAIGLTWLDARVKFIDGSAIVELRLLPTQPTIEEELFLTLFYIGRIIFSQAGKEPLLPMSYVRKTAFRQCFTVFGGKCGFMTMEALSKRCLVK